MSGIEKLCFCKIEGREAKIPERAHSGDAGIDIFAPLDMPRTWINPHRDVLIKTGLRVAVPEGYALIVKNKSGIATKKKLVIGACVIDHGYTGELTIHLMNVSLWTESIDPGEKITQVILVPVETPEVSMVSEDEYMNSYGDSERGEGGFGSTGNK